MNLMNARGVRDFPPEEKILRNRVMDSLRYAFERYGFVPLETPIIEREEVLASKYAGGEEILKEMFRFSDQGKRKLALRYDLTVPFARYVGMNPTMKMPFKRYAIGRVFRDGPIKLGRYREFWQCDADIVGAKSMLADAECIKIAQLFFKSGGFDVEIEVNNRKLLDGILEAVGVPEDKRVDVILEIDKLKKVGLEAVKKEICAKGVCEEDVLKLIELLDTNGTNTEKVEKLRKLAKNDLAKEGIDELEELFRYVDENNVTFSISLARGLAYYTGTVFEVFLKDSDFTGSLAAGGRYDNMIGTMLGGKKMFPAVGISFGLEPITDMLKKKFEAEKAALPRSNTMLYVVPIGTLDESTKAAEQLRSIGLNVDMDIMGRGVSKNLQYASAQGIPLVVLIGEDEVKQGKVKLRDMKTGEEELLTMDGVVKKLRGGCGGDCGGGRC